MNVHEIPKAARIPVDAPACEIKGTMSPGVNEQQVPAIPVAEVRRRIKENQLDGTIILDVRPEPLFSASQSGIK